MDEFWILYLALGCACLAYKARWYWRAALVGLMVVAFWPLLFIGAMKFKAPRPEDPGRFTFSWH